MDIDEIYRRAMLRVGVGTVEESFDQLVRGIIQEAIEECATLLDDFDGSWDTGGDYLRKISRSM